MADRSVTVRVPATSANLGPGFDSLGVALDWSALIRITTRRAPQPQSEDVVARMAAQAAATLFHHAGERVGGVEAVYEGDIPVGRGLGVSAAARAGGLVAANAMLASPLSLVELLPIAVRLEGHGDNIIPALLGGIRVVVHDEETPVQAGIAPPEDLHLALFIPDFSMPTEESRKRLPESLTRSQAVHNIGRSALVVAAITQGRYELLATAVQDILHQPARSALFPAMYPIFEAARAAGAYGAYLSGGGSTVAAFVSPAAAEGVAAAMRDAAAAHDLRGESRVVAMSVRGTEVIEAGDGA